MVSASLACLIGLIIGILEYRRIVRTTSQSILTLYIAGLGVITGGAMTFSGYMNNNLCTL